MNEIAVVNKGRGLAPAEGPGARFCLLPSYQQEYNLGLGEFLA